MMLRVGSISTLTFAVATAQLLSGSTGQDGAFSSGQLLCNGNWGDANATGIYRWSPDVAQGPQSGQPNNTSGRTTDIRWAVSVAQYLAGNNATTQSSLWYSPQGANYSDDFSLGYDVCAFALDTISENTERRGQNDTGDCRTTFDSACTTALENEATQYAQWLTTNPTPEPNSNLTSTSLPAVCKQIASLLTSNFPSACTTYFDGSATVRYQNLTGYKSSIVRDSNCHVQAGQYQFGLLESTWSNASSQAYANGVHQVVPLITTFMPIANGARPASIESATSNAFCLRAKNITKGSETPAPLPAATSASASTNEISGGAIAGIVVGSVLGVGVIAGLLVWFCLRKRRTTGTRDTLKEGGNVPEKGQGQLAEAPTNPPRAELDSAAQQKPAELSSRGGYEPVELASKGRENPAELEGTVP